MIGTRRRHGWLVAGLFPVAVAGVIGTAWVVKHDPGGPDPGGRILAALQTVERAVPQRADVLLEQANEPRWDSCDGRAGTFGWDDVTVYVQFPAQWSRTVAGSTVATATLGPETDGLAPGVHWGLAAVAPPRGQRVSGC